MSFSRLLQRSLALRSRSGSFRYEQMRVQAQFRDVDADVTLSTLILTVVPRIGEQVVLPFSTDTHRVVDISHDLRRRPNVVSVSLRKVNATNG